ncbi:MAG TPA: hypothetical protein ENH54_02455, partial [Actinobacteria bacterium]|nr:hypothetical protein [Actinomycetota bacterium]
MSIKRKRHVRKLTFTIVPVLLIAIAAMVPAFLMTNDSADAMDLSEGTVVANAIDTYINSQYVATDDGEAGFLMDGGPWTGTGATLKDRIDSNNDGV